MNQEDDRLKERIILLMRLYWRDEIHKIGTELEIDEMKKVENYWDLEHYKGALLIAKVLDDDGLKELLSKHPPKYVQMDGFQGQYYTVNKKGRFNISNSWPAVRENVRKSLENWGDKTYGVLKALINKKGNSAYFELIDEIGHVLGKEYVPSWILPRLEPLKLVFKTGSNKYPRWTIPTEIIPAIELELQDYILDSEGKKKINKGKTKKVPREEESDSLLSIERKLDRLVSNLVERKREINIIFQRKFYTRFFNDNEKAIMSIKKPCSNEEEFDNRIQGLSSIIDDVDTEKIKKAVKTDQVKGSINLMEFMLHRNGESNAKDVVKNLRMLKILRNKKFPAHSDDGKFIEATSIFGQEKFPPDWQVLWENVLEGTVETLEKFRDSLQ